MSAVTVDEELTEWFKIAVGVSQVCGLSLDLFNLLLQPVVRFALNSVNAGMMLNGEIPYNLCFADDVDLVAESPRQLQELTDSEHDSSKRFELQINVQKTKTMTIGKHHKELKVKLHGEELEQVTEFLCFILIPIVMVVVFHILLNLIQEV